MRWCSRQRSWNGKRTVIFSIRRARSVEKEMKVSDENVVKIMSEELFLVDEVEMEIGSSKDGNIPRGKTDFSKDMIECLKVISFEPSVPRLGRPLQNACEQRRRLVEVLGRSQGPGLLHHVSEGECKIHHS